MLESMTAELFRRHVGDTFRMRVDDATTLDATLDAVQEAAWAYSPADGRTPFSIYFRTLSTEIRPQRIYRLEHDTLGAVDLFLVPSSRNEQGVLYEAVFN